MASRIQSMFKSIIWRIFSVYVLLIVTYFFTRNIVITTKITFVHHAVFLIVFYLHERLWEWYKKILNDPLGKWQSVVKSIIYEIILGMGIGGLIVYFFTGSSPMVTRITGTYTVIKLVMYYFNEKLWK